MEKRTIVSAILFVFFVTTWYFWIVYPPSRKAEDFLTALKTRDKDLLARSVAPVEYETYYDLYLKNGYYKRLLNYKSLKKISSAPFPVPTRVTYGLEVGENDQIFGVRKLRYKLMLHKFDYGWRVLRFSSESDAEDLKYLERLRFSEDVE